MVNEWGPALLVCLTIVAGLFYGNSRLSDLRSDINERLKGMEKRIDDRFSAMDKRFDDLKDWIRAEILRLEERSSPIQRG